MMHQDLLRKAFNDPLVLQGFKRRQSIDRVPVQALIDEVEELLVRALSENVL